MSEPPRVDVLSTYTEVQLLDIHATVCEVLDVAPHESLSAAAFRTVRHNIAPPHVQRIARLILTASTGRRPPIEQWRTLDQCAAIAREHKGSKA